MSASSVLLPGNHTKLPAAVVSALALKPRAKLMFVISDDSSVTLTAKTASFADLAGTFPKKPRSKPASDEELNAAIRKGAARRSKRTR